MTIGTIAIERTRRTYAHLANESACTGFPVTTCVFVDAEAAHADFSFRTVNICEALGTFRGYTAKTVDTLFGLQAVLATFAWARTGLADIDTCITVFGRAAVLVLATLHAALRDADLVGSTVLIFFARWSPGATRVAFADWGRSRTIFVFNTLHAALFDATQTTSAIIVLLTAVRP